MDKINNIVILLVCVIAISCGNKRMQEKIENQCDLSHIRSINNGKISFYQVSESESKLVTKPVEKIYELIVSCKSDAIFPKEIGQLKNLTTLSLGGGNFNELPIEIGKLENLESLILINTSVKNLPIEMYRVSKFKRLAIMYNKGEFEFGEELCESNIDLDVMYTSTTIKELPNCLRDSNKLKLINKEAY